MAAKTKKKSEEQYQKMMGEGIIVLKDDCLQKCSFMNTGILLYDAYDLISLENAWWLPKDSKSEEEMDGEGTVLRRQLSKTVFVCEHWYSSLWCICMYTCKRIYVNMYIYIHEFIYLYISTNTRSDYLHHLLHPLRPCPPADYYLIPCPILNLRCRPAASCWGPLLRVRCLSDQHMRGMRVGDRSEWLMW